MGWLQDLMASFFPAMNTNTTGGNNMATYVGRITGGDKSTNNFGVAGTDLGIAYHDSLNKNRINMVFGDSFSSPFPGGGWDQPGEGQGWRSPVVLTSPTPKDQPLVFDYAVGGGYAKEAFFNAHDTRALWNPLTEFTVIPNDAIWLPETGRQIMSWMSINKWDYPGGWRSGYSSLSYSDNGQDWFRVPNLAWWNTENAQDPYQMWSMDKEGDYIYIVSVKSGRRPGPMKVRRVHYMNMFNKNAYEDFTPGGNLPGLGTNVAYGEPSLRRIGNVWALSYVNYSRWYGAALVTRTAASINGPWSPEKTQVTIQQEPNLYGGFIDPRSTGGTNGATFYVSRWTQDTRYNTSHYHTSQYVGTL